MHVLQNMEKAVYPSVLLIREALLGSAYYPSDFCIAKITSPDKGRQEGGSGSRGGACPSRYMHTIEIDQPCGTMWASSPTGRF